MSGAVLLAIVLCKCLEKLPGKDSTFSSEDVDMVGRDAWCVLEESVTAACHCVLLAISCLQLHEVFYLMPVGIQIALLARQS